MIIALWNMESISFYHVDQMKFDVEEERDN